MKKIAIIVLLVWCLFVAIVWPYRVKSYADPFTAGQIASTAYAMMQSWGIAFSSGSATAEGMNSFMTNQVEDYVNSRGGSIADVFVGQIAVDAAGKLVVAQEMYNSMVGFVDWLGEKYDLSSVDFTLTDGQYRGYFVPTSTMDSSVDIDPNGVSVLFDSPRGQGYAHVRTYKGTWNNFDNTLSNPAFYFGQWYIAERTGSIGIFLPFKKVDSTLSEQFISLGSMSALDNSLSWNGSNYVEPTILNPGKEWVGDIDGYSQPDTNLDQLMSGINQAVADNNLDVDGEIIDVPVPPGPIPTWTPVDDVIDGINGLGEELDGIGQDIGDISGHLDDIGDQMDDMTGALEGVQEGIQTQTGVISGAIEQATQDVVDAIGEQTATLDQTLTETAEGVQDIAEALQPGEIEPKQFDLRRLFPFCIPFDIHNLLQKFNATPVAPHVQLPFVIQSLGFSYTFDLDFSAFDSVAQAMRTVEFIVFAIGLAWATSKVIKW